MWKGHWPFWTDGEGLFMISLKSIFSGRTKFWWRNLKTVCVQWEHTCLKGQCKLCVCNGEHMCSRNPGDCWGCAEPMKLTWLDLEKEPRKVYWEEPGALATVLSYRLFPSSRRNQWKDLWASTWHDHTQCFAIQTTGWKYLRVNRKSSQNLIGNDMKPTVV